MEVLRLPTALSDVDLESQPSPAPRSESPEIEMTHAYTRFDQPKETHPPTPPEPMKSEPSVVEAPTVLTVHQVHLVAIHPPAPPKSTSCVLLAVGAIVVYYLLVGYVGKLLLWAIDPEFSHNYGGFWTLNHYIGVFLITMIGAAVYTCSRLCVAA